MAALTSGSWTITYRKGDRRADTGMTDYQKYVGLKLVLASGEPPLALKLPSYGSVGLTRQLDKYIMDNPILVASGDAGASVSGALGIRYLVTGNQVKFHRIRAGILASGTGTAGGMVALATTVTIKSQTFYVTAVGW